MSSEVCFLLLSFFGPPGSGKGTLAAQVVEKDGYTVLSTGNLCRRHIAEKTDIGILIEKYLAAGELIPDDMITNMVMQWLEDHKNVQKPIILDGFPRTKSQAALFLPLQAQMGCPYRIVFFEIDDDEVVQRLSNRLVCGNKKCQTVYGIVAKPPQITGKCDKCGSKLVKRADDDEQVIRKRLAVYAKYKQELLDFYSETGLPILQLPVGDKTPQEVYELFVSMLGTI